MIDIETHFIQSITAIRDFCYGTFGEPGNLLEARDLAETIRTNLCVKLRSKEQVDALLSRIGVEEVQEWLEREKERIAQKEEA